MRRIFAAAGLALLLCGCGRGNSAMDRALTLRETILRSESCQFAAAVTADYGDKLYTFRMNCQADNTGTLSFTVEEPESISGISGSVSGSGGTLNFDDTLLSFPTMADGQISPVTAPWVLLKALREGYISSAGQEGQGDCLSIDDSYREDALHLDVWTDSQGMPVRGEILYGGRRILSLDVTDFTMG